MLWPGFCSHGHREEVAEVARWVSGMRHGKECTTTQRRMTVRKLSVWPVVQPEQCKLGTFSTAAASATAGRSALIAT